MVAAAAWVAAWVAAAEEGDLEGWAAVVVVAAVMVAMAPAGRQGPAAACSCTRR